MEKEIQNKKVYIVETIVNHCRYLEKNNKGAGVEFINEMLNDDVLPKDLYDQMVVAIENFDTPYAVKI